MLKPNIESALNDQMNKEFWSAYIYLAIVGYFENKSLPGMAEWMRVQYDEEVIHARKFFEYIIERGGTPKISSWETPRHEFSSPLEVFEYTLEHEQLVTSSINDLYSIAESEKDTATKIFLQWFVEEQVEEEDNVSSILGTLELLGDSGHGIFLFDRELGQRTLPATPAE
jgi:ferritin